MASPLRSLYYSALKEAGVKLEKHYRDYSADDLLGLLEFYGLGIPSDAPPPPTPEQQIQEADTVPRSNQPLQEHAAQRAYSGVEETVIRVDQNGREWFREEVRKPAFPKPRARRVIQYTDPGVKKDAAINDRYRETFEVAGEGQRIAQVKITMPSYQVGVYRERNNPFKIHVYNDVKGFDLFDVQKFFGGSDMVPETVKRIYVENSLCYDIRTTIRAVQEEYRRTVLKENRS